mgnify:CR=1 FL=1
MAELEKSLKDEPLRKDLIALLDRITKSTENVSRSMESLNKITGDKELRGDVKEIVNKAHDAVNKVDRVIASPDFKGNINSTLEEVRSAANHMDIAAQQMNQILNKRAPLLHMMIGRPGKLDEKTKKEVKKEVKKQVKNEAKEEVKNEVEKQIENQVDNGNSKSNNQ